MLIVFFVPLDHNCVFGIYLQDLHHFFLHVVFSFCEWSFHFLDSGVWSTKVLCCCIRKILTREESIVHLDRQENSLYGLWPKLMLWKSSVPSSISSSQIAVWPPEGDLWVSCLLNEFSSQLSVFTGAEMARTDILLVGVLKVSINAHKKFASSSKGHKLGR